MFRKCFTCCCSCSGMHVARCFLKTDFALSCRLSSTLVFATLIFDVD